MILDSLLPLFKLMDQLSILPSWRHDRSYNMDTNGRRDTQTAHRSINMTALVGSVVPLTEFIKTAKIIPPTFLQASDETFVWWQFGGFVFDLFWNPQLLSDHRVFEQSHLAQGEAVGGQPVGEHRLVVVKRSKRL